LVGPEADDGPDKADEECLTRTYDVAAGGDGDESYHGMWNVECGMWYVVCGMWYVVYGIW
jgi:hypothetical protein